MKKMLFCAAAAIAALASCSKTQVVYNDAPEEIAFKQITGVMTKTQGDTPASTNPGLDLYHSTMGVFANVNVTNAVYFGNTSFSPKTVDTETYWGGTQGAIYWPFQTELQFIVYAPYYETQSQTTPSKPQASVEYKIVTNTESNVNPVDGDNSDTQNSTIVPTLEIKDFEIKGYTEATPEATATTAETLNVDDLMYGEKVYNANSNSGTIGVVMKHALARIEVNVKATVASVITINSIVLNGVTKQASLSVSYSDDPITTDDPSLVGTPAWSPVDNNKLNLTIGTSNSAIATANDLASYGNPFLVIPGTQTTFTINYTLNGVPSKASVNLNGSWDAGKKYIYDFTFGINEIKFTPTVTDWVEGNLSGTSTDNNITVATKPVRQ